MEKITWFLDDLFDLDESGRWQPLPLMDGEWINDEWYSFILTKYFQVIPELYGERELVISKRDYKNQLALTTDNFKKYLQQKVVRRWHGLFAEQREWYNHLYDTLNLEYNPLYNVDGTEIRNYEKSNTGTQGNKTEKLGSEKDSIVYSGEEVKITTTSGEVNQTLNKSGSESTDNDTTISYNGSELNDNIRSGKINRSESTFDSINVPSNSEEYDGISDSSTKSFDKRNDITDSSVTLTFNDRKDETNTIYNDLTDNEHHSFNDRNDEVTKTFTGRVDDTTRTDDLLEQYTERVERFGNIGVTKSTDLVESELELREKWNVAEIICRDMVNIVTYGIM